MTEAGQLFDLPTMIFISLRMRLFDTSSPHVVHCLICQGIPNMRLNETEVKQ